MISKQQYNVIKTILGKQYSISIIDYLTKKKIFNAKGEPFSPDSIQLIVRGKRPNIEIENHIAKLVANRKKQLEKSLQIRKELIKK